jgi:hypothetical protein
MRADSQMHGLESYASRASGKLGQPWQVQAHSHYKMRLSGPSLQGWKAVTVAA